MGDCLDESPSLCYNKGHQVILVALSLLLMAGVLKIGTWTATFYARENEMKENMKIRGQLRTYLQWPIILSVFLLAANLAVGIVSPAAGLVMSGFTVMYVLVALWLFMYRRKRLMGGLVEFSAEYAWVQKQLLYEMAVPYAIADTEGHFLWLNHSFSEIVGEDKNCRKNIAAVFPELTREFLDEMDEKTSVHSSFDGRFYRIDIQQVALSGRYEAWRGGRGQR
jgi:PAS domain-containing protein